MAQRVALDLHCWVDHLAWSIDRRAIRDVGGRRSGEVVDASLDHWVDDLDLDLGRVCHEEDRENREEEGEGHDHRHESHGIDQNHGRGGTW